MMHWDYWRLLTVISLAGFVGLLFGQMMTFMFIASFLYALWLQRAWHQLWHWIQKPKKYSSPHAEGAIDEVCREIESIRSQNRLRKKKLAGYLKRFQAATTALPDAIVVLTELGQVSWSNLTARELLGIQWPRDNYIRIDNLIRDPAFTSLLNEPKIKGRSVVVTSPVSPDKQLEIQVVSYMGDSRLVIAQDVTQNIKLERMRRDFIANVSHELRTPLTVLKGYLETFDAKTDPEIWASAVLVMLQQSDRMKNLLDDLLVLSQMETGGKAIKQSPVNIGELLTMVVKDAKQLEAYQDHQIELVIETDKWLYGDMEELRSAVSNLVFNAVKYSQPTTKIEIRWAIEDDIAYIEVNDSGEGVADHHLEKLTERFYRVDSGRSQEMGGTGLGLAIVKHVLQRHDANLQIRSKLGSGSEFWCCFPADRVRSSGNNLII